MNLVSIEVRCSLTVICFLIFLGKLGNINLYLKLLFFCCLKFISECRNEFSIS
jgi:hypothetical protein